MYLRIWFSWVHNFHFWRLQENSYTNNASKASDFHTRWLHKNSNTKISHSDFKSQLWTVFLKSLLKDYKQRFWTPLPPLPIYHKPSATNYTHYHIMMARIVLHSVIRGSTSSLAPHHKFNVLEASNTQSRFSLLLSPHTEHTLHLSWLLFSATDHCSSIKGNLFWLLVLEMHPILFASSSKSLQNGFFYLDENS